MVDIAYLANFSFNKHSFISNRHIKDNRFVLVTLTLFGLGGRGFF